MGGGERVYEQKTKETDHSVMEFIENVEPLAKREDAYRLLDIFTEATGCQARMWGTSIIGFGSYRYRYESGHEGVAPLVGFSPRKANISLYLAPGDPEREALLKDLGKHSTGKGCVYIKKVSDINNEVLIDLIKKSVLLLKERYPS
jgi:hypothetical protein